MAAPSMTVLLDSDVLIDILRRHPAAEAWLKRDSEVEVAVHGVVAMEIISGSTNKDDLRRNQAFLSRFTIAWPTPTEFEQAYLLLGEYHLATGINIPDCLIAATALNRGWQLFTFNLKHYRHIAGLQVNVPYTR